MKIELHIEKLEYERRANRLGSFAEQGIILGRFLSLRDDDQFVWLREPSDAAPSTDFVLMSNTRRLTSVPKALLDVDDLLACEVVEIRQYRLAPGMRSRFAAFLRDRTLADQLRLGMTIYGPFEDDDDPDVLTWLRGFPSLAERDRSKAAFYQGERWLSLQDEAFAMIADYSNVILATPVHARPPAEFQRYTA